jgi:hypothetical protein
MSPHQGTQEETEPRVEERCVVPARMGTEKSRRYIPGVPMHLFDRACALPGKSLAVFLILWRLARMEGRWQVTLTTAQLKQHRLSRHEKETALRHLEQAGLITVKRSGRRNPLVTLLISLPAGCEGRGPNVKDHTDRSPAPSSFTTPSANDPVGPEGSHLTPRIA